MKKIIVPLGLLLGAVALASLFVSNQREFQPRQPESPPVTVRVVEVAPGSARFIVHAQGTVSPRTESELVPEVSGNVVWLSPNLISGGYFEPGEVLLRIDQRDYQAAVGRAEASLAGAAADFELAQFDLERANDLFGRSLISQADRETAERTARVAEASLRDAQLVLESARRDLTRTELKAPFAGLVRSEQVDVGQFVGRGSTIASIYATDFLEIRLPIADQELAYLNIPLSQRGEFAPEASPSVRLSAEFAGRRQTWEARLVRTEAEIDPGTRMVYAIARLPGDQDHREEAIAPPVGLFVQAEIDGRELDSVVVLPRSALRDENSVLVVDTENRVSRRAVEVLRINGDSVYVSNGLEAGELVSISMLQTVVEGMRVQPLRSES
ncbi:MAG: efflux RND transporter periplasmic adaptor subunit [Gammaproteobacteria bacterium]|jgi:RND family efflux transporter MFP subunit